MQSAGSDRAYRLIERSFAVGVAQEMFAGGDRAVAQVVGLHATHEGNAHNTAQVGILAVGFMDAAPARITVHVKHRREHMIDTDRTSLATGNRSQLFDQLRSERGRQTNRGRKRSRRSLGQTRQRLVVHHRGDLQPGVVTKPLLDRVDPQRQFTRVARQTSAHAQMTHPMRDRLSHLVDIRAIWTHERSREHTDDLRGFLLQGHSRQQVVDPLTD